MQSSITRFLSLLAFAALALCVAAPAVHAQAEQEKLVAAAEATFSNFHRDKEMNWLNENLHLAKAVLIAPRITKAGFIIGGSGGRAVLVARDAKTGKWMGPAFYTLATASVGFQAGVEVSEAVTLVMTDKALNSLLSSSFKLGADVSIAAGPIGVGSKATVTADMVAFNRSKGLYGGLNLDGTVVKTSDDWNDAFYGKKGALPPDILVRGSAVSDKGEKLRAAVAAAATRK